MYVQCFIFYSSNFGVIIGNDSNRIEFYILKNKLDI